MKVNPLIRLCFNISQIRMVGSNAIVTITPKKWFSKFFNLLKVK